MNNVNIKKKLFNYYLFLTIVPKRIREPSPDLYVQGLSSGRSGECRHQNNQNPDIS